MLLDSVPNVRYYSAYWYSDAGRQLYGWVYRVSASACVGGSYSSGAFSKMTDKGDTQT
jgi:hypothetical protein